MTNNGKWGPCPFKALPEESNSCFISVILSPGCTRWKLAEIEAGEAQRTQVKAD
jgi:hypothetical protein